MQKVIVCSFFHIFFDEWNRRDIGLVKLFSERLGLGLRRCNLFLELLVQALFGEFLQLLLMSLLQVAVQRSQRGNLLSQFLNLFIGRRQFLLLGHVVASNAQHLALLRLSHLPETRGHIVGKLLNGAIIVNQLVDFLRRQFVEIVNVFRHRYLYGRHVQHGRLLLELLMLLIRWWWRFRRRHCCHRNIRRPLRLQSRWTSHEFLNRGRNDATQVVGVVRTPRTHSVHTNQVAVIVEIRMAVFGLAVKAWCDVRKLLVQQHIKRHLAHAASNGGFERNAIRILLCRHLIHTELMPMIAHQRLDGALLCLFLRMLIFARLGNTKPTHYRTESKLN
mmetsp:Transcript_41340/g.68010  ORF Transcript_41340/g.68010 Transcript_41340/m.68010 type:complete len:333 (-) Transcript_41340:1416-2414(-)